MENGWIKLHRKIVDWEWYRDEKTFRVFLHILLKSNHENKKWQGVMVEKGQWITSYYNLSHEIGLGVQSVRTSLNKLKSTGELTIKNTSKYSLITVLKWNDYQSTNTPPNKPLTNDQHATNTRLTTNKKYKNIRKKRIKEVIAPSEQSSPLVSELIKLFEEINPTCKTYYGNTTQKKASQFLIDEYGFDKVSEIVKKVLPQTNGKEFFPSITTPYKLKEKWADLKSKCEQYNSQLKATKQKQGNVYW